MACDSLRGAPLSDVKNEVIEGFVLVKASGQSTTLGTKKSSAPLKERPQMNVDFTYDYYIGDHEVTCEEYNSAITESSADEGSLFPCMGPNWPMINATYYDAVIYANALSKMNNLDTAYTYLSLKFDSEGHCIDLEGLRFLPEVYGYRLPTEAEWVYAASHGWNPKYGWTSEVSGYTLHQIRMKPANMLNIYDMAGNLMEWVNDWFGYFRDTTLTNYVGFVDGGNIGERIVKGGSFRNEAKNINLYSRSDVYMVTSASKAEYVGFRLALGVIPDATWLSSGGATVANTSELLTGSSKVNKQTESIRTKLVFRNDVTGNLSYVDYFTGALKIVEIQDTLDVFHPDISPDGRKVAFSTSFEGVSGKSSVYVRDLNYQGSNLVKLDVESATIPRWRILDNGDTVIVYVSDAGVNTLDEEFFGKSTWQVKFSEGKFGTPQKLFDGSYHGGVSDDNRLAVTGARILRAHEESFEGVKDTIWFDGDQICNVSLSNGNDKRVLYLDFAGKTGKEYVGSRYSVHEYLFVADSNGNILNAIRAPKGYTFDHSEWVASSDPIGVEDNLAVVSLTNANNAHEKIALVDLSNGSITDLVKGDELWHPCLWRKNVKNFAKDKLDSIGVYYKSPVGTSEGIMKVKMRMFWESKDSLELIAIGSSRVERGFMPLQISSYKSFNFGYSGSELWGELYLAENYILNHAKNLKVLVMELPLDLQSNTPEFKNQMVFEQAPGYIYDKNHGFWKNGLPENFLAYIAEFLEYNEEDENTYVKTGGWLVEDCVGWKGNEIEYDSIFTEKVRTYYNNVMDSLDQFIEDTKDLGIKLVVVIFPQSPAYAQTGAFGRYGVQRSLAMETIDHYRKLEKKYNHLHFVDENKMGNHDYTDAMAVDYDHLCADGAERFSQKLDSLLKTFD